MLAWPVTGSRSMLIDDAPGAAPAAARDVAKPCNSAAPASRMAAQGSADGVAAAAGVVADSVPELEWKETEAKARALIRAAELVEEGI